MGWSFFVRFSTIGSGWDVDDDQLILASRVSETLWIDTDGPLRTASHLVLRGTEYSTEDEAEDAGRHALAALRLSLVQTGTPADFLERKLMSQLSDDALALAGSAGNAAQEAEDPSAPRIVVVNQRAGVVPHPSNERYLSFRSSATGVAIKPAAPFVDGYQTAIRIARADEAADLAFDLWSAANLMPSIDSRFLTLVNAVEALTEQQPVNGEELEAVGRLRSAVKDMGLDPSLRDLLLGRLGDFRRESVGRAARRLLAQNVPDKLYDGMSAGKFFSGIYEMRSRLTHGAEAPSHHDVAAVTPELFNLVRDLIERRLSTLPLDKG